MSEPNINFDPMSLVPLSHNLRAELRLQGNQQLKLSWYILLGLIMKQTIADHTIIYSLKIQNKLKLRVDVSGYALCSSWGIGNHGDNAGHKHSQDLHLFSILRGDSVLGWTSYMRYSHHNNIAAVWWYCICCGKKNDNAIKKTFFCYTLHVIYLHNVVCFWGMDRSNEWRNKFYICP